MEKEKVFMVLLVALAIFLAVVLATAVIGKVDQPASGNWTLSLNAQSAGTAYSQRFASDDSFLYTADGRDIYCLGPQGLEWSVTPEDPSKIMPAFDRWNVGGAVSDGSRSYLLIYPGSAEMPGFQLQLIAVSKEGRLLWTRQLGSIQHPSIAAGGGNVYVLNENNITVLDRNGNVQWGLGDDIAYTPSVDAAGNLYVLRGGIEGTIMEAYSPDGTLRWSTDVANRFQDIPNGNPTQCPIYHNGTLFIWLTHGLAAYGDDGRFRWNISIPDQYWYAVGGYVPDSAGYVYVCHNNVYSDDGADYFIDVNGTSVWAHDTSKDEYNNYMTMIGLDGSQTRINKSVFTAGAATIANGVAYFTNGNIGNSGQPLDKFEPRSVDAYDVMSGDRLWSFRLPAAMTGSVILNESNSRYLMPDRGWFATQVNKQTPAAWYQQSGMDEGTVNVEGWSTIMLYRGKEALYVNYWAYNYENPPFFGRANLTYTGGLFALDREGHLLWSKLTDSYITGVSEKNGTVFFATGDGKFSAVSANIAAGLVAAAAYLFIRIFALGTISRARSRIDSNVNRNGILKLVADRPGSTMHDIARETGMNIGTVRYHMLILSMNHKITAYSDGTKFVRYFRNVNAFSEDQKLVIGLMRREPLRKVLSIMAGKPPMTNLEIAMAAGIKESAASKYLRELLSTGIVVKSPASNDKPAYSIDCRYRQIVPDAFQSLHPDSDRMYERQAVAAIACDR